MYIVVAFLKLKKYRVENEKRVWVMEK